MDLSLPVVRLARIPDGIAGVDVTLKVMAGIVRAYKITPMMRMLATQIIADVPAKNWLGEIAAVFNYVRQNIRYTQDPAGVEMLQTPDRTLFENSFGDCDDMAIAICTLLESIGYNTRFVACGAEPGIYEHVFVQVQLPDQSRYISLDPTEPQPLGWAPQGLACYKARDNNR